MLEVLKETGLSHDSLRLEITETAIMHNPVEAFQGLQALRDLGVGLCIDDFGIGYSSLSRLQQLPIDILKIDRSFVRNLDNNPHDKVIVKAIIQLAQTLGILVVAEGVENLTQSHFLTENQCFVMQGYLFSQALPADEFERFMLNNKDSVA